MFGLFINGVWESVLEEIVAIQSELPDHIMFLQPHAARRIAALHDHPPTLDTPVPLYLSTTDDYATVRYQGELVGCEDKREIAESRARVLNRLIWTLHPGEGGLYLVRNDGNEFVNLLHVRRLRKLPTPFRVSELTKTSDDLPLSEGRTQGGGWAYVRT